MIFWKTRTSFPAKKGAKQYLSFVLLSKFLLLPISAGELDYAEFSKDILAFRELRETVPIEKIVDFVDNDGVLPDFEPTDYFEIFTHLSVKEGFVLDWVYESNEWAGAPCLYTRPKEQERFSTHEELLDSVSEEAQLPAVRKVYQDYQAKVAALPPAKERTFTGKDNSDAGFGFSDIDSDRQQRISELMQELDARLAEYPRREYWDWWKEDIKCDGTDQGYLELAALYLLGNQFGLYWHALTNDTEILPDHDSLIEVVDRPVRPSPGIDGILLPPEVRDAARKIEQKPTVTRSGETVTITFLTFTKWGGFERMTMELSATFPHNIIRETTEEVVEYHSGIVY
ncbi:MAG: hypothetical protein CMO55_25180 [Verrucomicrobiales bacterium]|nr:hypothetical protein [Verrucomicrobiales bacterium]